MIVRPSGTEPKLKAYLQVVEPVLGGDLDARAEPRRRRWPTYGPTYADGLVPTMPAA